MKLENIENAINQNQFWDMWNNFNTKQPQALPIQYGDIWRAHFEKLQTLEETIKDNQNPLDFLITWEELITQTKSLQPRKACDPDSIKHEMLKSPAYLFNVYINELAVTVNATKRKNSKSSNCN